MACFVVRFCPLWFSFSDLGNWANSPSECILVFVHHSRSQQRMHLNVCDIRNRLKRMHIHWHSVGVFVCYFRSIVCSLHVDVVVLNLRRLWLSSAPTRFINVCMKSLLIVPTELVTEWLHLCVLFYIAISIE